MNEQLKRLGLTQLARVLPMLLDEARQQQLSYCHCSPYNEPRPSANMVLPRF